MQKRVENRSILLLAVRISLPTLDIEIDRGYPQSISFGCLELVVWRRQCCYIVDNRAMNSLLICDERIEIDFSKIVWS